MSDVSPKPFAVFDIDGTLIRWQLFHAIVHSLGKQGYLPAAAHDRIKQARMSWKVRSTNDGFSEYEAILVKEYLGVLKEISPAQYDTIVQEVFDEYKDQTYTYTRDLVRDLKQKGYVLLAISGSHDEIIQKLARHQGFDGAQGATFEQIDGTFSGQIDSPIFDKAKVLQRLIHEYNLTTENSVGVGDSASDIPMLALVSRPIVFNPDKKMFMAAKERSGEIVVERKNMIYQLYHQNGHYLLRQE
jgi:HAD superfamily hydrolase (TIGR01490 family)